MEDSNKALATRIVEYAGGVSMQESPEIYSVDLQDLLGITLGSAKKKKEAAQTEVINQLAGLLNEGSLVLSDTWEEDHLKPKNES